MSQELDYTIEVSLSVLEADTLKELSKKLSKAESGGGEVKRVFALVVKTSNVPQGIE